MYNIACAQCQRVQEAELIAINDDESMICACIECGEEVEIIITPEGTFIREVDDDEDVINREIRYHSNIDDED